MRFCPALLTLLLAGCATGPSALSTDAAVTGAEWLELDLANGQVRAVEAPDPSALAQARWRTSHVLFRRIAAGHHQASVAALPGISEAEDAASSASTLAFVAVFELTVDQWHRLSGEGTAGSELPATRLCADEVNEALAARPTSHFRLNLPDAGLWNVACAAGSDGLFAWGNGTAISAAGGYAVHYTPGAGRSGPARVGSLAPNALGLYDLHGNVWELTRDGDGFAARGGAWDSPVLQCRTANRVAIARGLQHPSVGVRLVLRP